MEQNKQNNGIKQAKLNENSKVKNIIAVLSGKGGVGKSFVSGSLAAHLQAEGYKVGILDADITGPSVPKAFGITELAYSDGKNMQPQLSRTGIKIMSVNLILDNPTQPVLWRAPIVSNAIEQFFENVDWGELDYLLIDMPPGTGDVALTVFQSLPVDGAIIVTSPQDLVAMIVEKAVTMTKLLSVPILGFVENMSYFVCPNCGEKTEIYGKSMLKEIGKKHNVDNLLSIPINRDYAEKVDAGNIEAIEIEGYKDFIDNLK